MQKIGVIVQARMSSKRLPGKILKIVDGKPLLLFIVEKLVRCKNFTEFVIATSDHESDDPVESFCKKNNVSYYRGSLNDVASRFNEVSENYQWDAFVRINGDSPLIDPYLIDKGVELFRQGKFDLVTNISPRTFPPGQSVEVVKTQTFKNVYSKITTDEDFEHVTKYFYKNPEKFDIVNFSSNFNYGNIHFTVDTPEDFQQFSAIVTKMKKPHWEYHVDDLVKILEDF
jgi:spore coat polysaccharide biosynthesis protein SpsF